MEAKMIEKRKSTKNTINYYDNDGQIHDCIINSENIADYDYPELREMVDSNEDFIKLIEKITIEYSINKDALVDCEGNLIIAKEIFAEGFYITAYEHEEGRESETDTDIEFTGFDYSVTIIKEIDDKFMFKRRFIPSEVNGSVQGDACMFIKGSKSKMLCDVNCDKCKYNFTKYKKSPYSRLISLKNYK